MKLDVFTFKLVGGDEVIARAIFDEGSITLSNPLLVMMAQSGFGLMPYILTVDLKQNKTTIDRSHIIAYAPTIDQVAKEYVKQTSGLIV